MPYDAKVYKVMIASPGDVQQERAVARKIVQDWNVLHSEDKGIVLLPVGWETHSYPAMGHHPQEIINRQVVHDCDLLVAIFWTRLGSPTESFPSGTVEEIARHRQAGKPAMLYFSAAPVRPDSVDDEQYRALRQFREECLSQGLVESYENLSEFSEKFSRQLAQTVFHHFRQEDGHRDPLPADVPPASIPSLAPAARELLIEASHDRGGTVLRLRTLGGARVQTHDKGFGEPGDPRSEARWEAALRQLCDLGLLQDAGNRGEVFRLTDEGYRIVDLIVDAGGGPRRLHQGQVVRVASVTGSTVTLDTGESYGLGPPTRGHEMHEPVKAGDVLAVAKDSAPNGDTLVTLPCGCNLLLLAG